MRNEDLDTTAWIGSLVIASVGFGFWQHSVGFGLGVFFGTFVILILRRTDR